jgi:hypothetical protein
MHGYANAPDDPLFSSSGVTQWLEIGPDTRPVVSRHFSGACTAMALMRARHFERCKNDAVAVRGRLPVGTPKTVRNSAREPSLGEFMFRAIR